VILLKMAFKSAKTESELKYIKSPDWKNLQELPPLISAVCHEFYTSLLNTGQSQTATASVGRE
jgi:hypothetical protein